MDKFIKTIENDNINNYDSDSDTSSFSDDESFDGSEDF
jgi:hypothetical protein